MSLRTALLEMKEKIEKSKVNEINEDFILDLEKKNQLRSETLVYYYNFFVMKKMKGAKGLNKTKKQSKKENRRWTKSEIDFMFHYISERDNESFINITDVLEEVARLLNRGYQSVNYKYYDLIKERDIKQKSEYEDYTFTTITEKEVPVLSTEVAQDTLVVEPVNQVIPSQGNDLLDTLSGLITNVQQLPGIHLNELIKSLYLLTNMAIMNQESTQQIESIKAQANLEVASLREKLVEKEQQYLKEKKRNDELNVEVKKLAKEIKSFNQLGDAAKIQNLKSYNRRLNYIIRALG